MLDALLDEILEREGSKDTNNPNDSGGRTKYGISIKSHPEAWVNGPPSKEEAKRIYLAEYLVKPNIHRVQPDYLRDQVADFAVMSGAHIAIQHLQRILNVEPDGNLGPQSFAALVARDGREVNNQLVVARALTYDRIVQKRPRDLEFLFGWHRRVLAFLR